MTSKGHAYKKMLASFGLVIILTISITIIFYLYSYHVIEDQVRSLGNNMVQTIQNTCDREIQFYQNYLTQIQMSERVLSLSRVSKMNNHNQLMAYYLVDELNMTGRAMSSYCKDIFIYFPKIDKVFSTMQKGVMSYDLYSTYFFAPDALEESVVKEYLNGHHTMDVVSVSTKLSGEEYLLISASCAKEGMLSAATVGAWLDLKALENRVSSFEWENGFEWIIVDENQKIIKEIGGGAEKYLDDRETFLSEKGYITMSSVSDTTGWEYILVMPKEFLNQSVEKIRTFFFVSLIFGILINVVVAIKMTKNNYKPLQNLLTMLSAENYKKIGNEYNFLREKMSSILKQHAEMEVALNRNKNRLKNWYLVHFLMNSYDRQEKTDEWQEYARPFLEGENLVVLLTEKPTTRENDILRDAQLRTFVIGNVFGEGIGEYFNSDIVQLNEYQVMIVNSDDFELKLGVLEEKIFEFQKYIVDHFKMEVLVFVGNVHTGIDGIHDSYLEAREAEEFLAVLDQDVICYEDIRDNTVRKYAYSLKMEERISAALQERNSQLVVSLIDRVLETNFKENQLNPDKLKCLLYDIYCTILKTADEMGVNIESNSLRRDISIAMPFQQIKEWYAKIVKAVCEEQNSYLGKNSDREFCSKVAAYVRENYNNPNLNISQTALFFGVSPSNLSTIYKKEMGKSLLTEINEVKIEKAIEFLKIGYSVAETAEKVGINESSSFIRLFKKYTGVTPGQMKDQFPTL